MATLRIDEQFVHDYIEDSGGLPEIPEAVLLILKYREADWYERKKLLISNWNVNQEDIYNIILSVFTACMVNEYLTYQAVVGMLNRKIKLEHEIDRVEILADIVGLIAQTGLIEIHSEQGEPHIVYTWYVPNKPIPMDDKHITITLRPQPVESNSCCEYGSRILGDSINYHDGYLRLSHLERMGQIAFEINKDFVNAYEEAPKNTPDTYEKEAQWELFKEESLRKYTELMEADQRFFIQHKYDCRGRCYSGSYYLNPQGNSFKKAAIQSADKEIVEGF